MERRPAACPRRGIVNDYIWQILFAGENDAVPKRVTGVCVAAWPYLPIGK